MNWLTEMILDYRKQLMNIEFYQYVKQAKDKEQFAWVRQLYHQSAEFPQLLSLRYSLCRKPEYRNYFAIHAEEEIGHAEMLKNWMIRHELLGADEDVNSVPVSLDTINASAYFYRMIITEDELAQLIGLNAVSEGTASDFYLTLAPLMRELDMGDEYWDIHAELDVEHSQECLEMIPDIDRNSPLGRKLEKLVHDSMLLMGTMLNSWIGVHTKIEFKEVQTVA